MAKAMKTQAVAAVQKISNRVLPAAWWPVLPRQRITPSVSWTATKATPISVKVNANWRSTATPCAEMRRGHHQRPLINSAAVAKAKSQMKKAKTRCMVKGLIKSPANC